jgi:hypothetical protein
MEGSKIGGDQFGRMPALTSKDRDEKRHLENEAKYGTTVHWYVTDP